MSKEPAETVMSGESPFEPGIQRHTESHVNLYERMIHPSPAVHEAASKTLYAQLKKGLLVFGGQTEAAWRFLDIGIGGGWMTLNTLYWALTDEDDACGAEIELVGVDTSEEMLKKFSAVLYGRFHRESFDVDETDNGRAYTVVCKSTKKTLSITLHAPQEFEKWTTTTDDKFDVCLALFVLHHMLPDWRKQLQRLVGMTKEHGQIVLSAIVGDLSAWTNSFDDIQDFPHDMSDPRLRYLRVLYEFQKACNQENVANVRPISASCVAPIIELLEQYEFAETLEYPISAAMETTFLFSEWLDAFGLDKNCGEPLFSVSPKGDENKGKREKIRASILESFAAQPETRIEGGETIPFKNHYQLHVLQQDAPQLKKRPDLLPPAERVRVVDYFSDLVDAEDEDQVRQMAINDLGVLQRFNIIRDPEFLVYIHMDVKAGVKGEWHKNMPIITHGSRGAARLTIYSGLVNKFSGSTSSERGVRFADYVYKDLPDKAILNFKVVDDPRPKVEVKLRRDGTVGCFYVSIPKGIVVTDIFNEFEDLIENDTRIRNDHKTKLHHRYDDVENGKFDVQTLISSSASESIFINRAIVQELAEEWKQVLNTLAIYRNNDCWNPGIEKGEPWNEHLARNAAFSVFTGVKEWTMIPSVDTREDRKCETGVLKSYEVAAGGLTIFYNNDNVSRVDTSLVQELLTLRNRSSYLSQYRARAVLDVSREAREVLRQARRAAVAAIMGRNMSHNLGSHVLARLSSDTFLMEAFRTFGARATETQAALTAEMLVFLKQRMDFVADISTGYSPAVPQGIRLWDTLLQPFLKQCLLWENLCASHDVSTSNLYFRVRVGDDRILSSGEDRSRVQDIIRMIQSPDPNAHDIPPAIRTAMIGVPNGVVGCHAFYCILENFVRNAAKHGRRPDGIETLEISLSFDKDEAYPDHLRITVSDNWEGANRDTECVKAIQEKVNAPLISKNGVIAAKNRGLKEMKAAALYLRRQSTELIDTPDPKDGPPILSVQNKDGSVAFVFYMPRPKEVFVVQSSPEGLSSWGNELQEQGIGSANTETEWARTCEQWRRSGCEYPFLLDLTEVGQNTFQNGDFANLPLRIIRAGRTVITAQMGRIVRTKSAEHCQETLDALRTALSEKNGLQIVALTWQLWIDVLIPNTKLLVLTGERDSDGKESQKGWRMPPLSLSESECFSENGALPNTVIYARHGFPLPAFARVFSFEPYIKACPVDALIAYPPERAVKDEKQTLICQLLEAGAIPIVIVDERIQEYVCKNREKFAYNDAKDVNGQHQSQELRSIDWLRGMQVYVPDLRETGDYSVKLTRPESGDKEHLMNWLRERAKEANARSGLLPFLVVHQGLLDSLGVKEKTEGEAWIRAREKEGFAAVIITSGRGNLSELPPNARFLPLSTLTQYATEQRSKYHLVQALTATRGVHRETELEKTP